MKTVVYLKCQTITKTNKMADKLTEQDLNDLQYCWQVTGDLERLTTFEILIPILEKEKPEVLKAWNDYKASKKIVDIVIGSLV